MKLFGVRYKGGELIGLSEYLDIIQAYSAPLIESGVQVEIGRTSCRSLSEEEIENLTLVQVGNQFVPAMYVDAYELITGEQFSDFVITTNVLVGLFEQEGLDRKTKKSIGRTLQFLYSYVKDVSKESINPRMLKEFQSTIDTYRGALGIDDQ
nr:MAG TPA: hypothetical protein [Caudoviricetes sp.]